MAYASEISRRNPACLLILVDQSGSMNEEIPADRTTKAKGVADVVNNLIAELINRNTNGEEVFDRFHVGVITYGDTSVKTPFGPDGLAPLSQIYEKPLRIETRIFDRYVGAGRMEQEQVQMPIWFDALGAGRTPMCEALGKAKEVLTTWVASHPSSFPPIVVNITDGEASDGDPSPAMRELQTLSTRDGSALLFNVLVTQKAGDRKVAYPADPEDMWDRASATLFESSSILPPALLAEASRAIGRELPAGARGVVLNASLVDLIKALEIGTRAGNAV